MGAALLTILVQLSEPSSAQAFHYYMQVPKTSSEFQIAVEELMKITYRNSDWSRFFGLAQFYRRAYSPHHRSEVEILEALALLRHCQTESLESLLAALKEASPKYQNTLDQILALSKTRFRGKQAESKDLRKELVSKHYQGNSFKEIKHAEIPKVDPRRLRIEVENLCDS